MIAKYLLTIDQPHTHQVLVRLDLEGINEKNLNVFLPSWSPGSYLMREYAKHLSCLKILDEKGKHLDFQKTAKGSWKIFDPTEKISIEYKIYCHELTVRTSHVDESHAFLHGPCLFMGVKNHFLSNIELELRFPPLWSKVNTGLEDVSKDREVFKYSAKSYDDLLDCPIEIGCQDTDGFQVEGKNHFLAFYGKTFPHQNNLKADIKKIVETVSEYMGGVPYDHYTFITHFWPNLYGGLEHTNSTVLAFDGRKLNKRTDYIKWLCLVTHEYFHTWNVKRIRPVELGPFDYVNENYTSMLWLVEGLTSFMDNYLTLKTGLISKEEYWNIIRDDLNLYFSIPGRKFDSLESSSYDAWIKLYRPHENSRNSTISYYLKGGLVFLILHSRLLEIGKSIKDLVIALWKDHLDRPEIGISKQEFFEILKEISNEEISFEFEKMLETTEEIDFESELKKHFVEIDYNRPKYTLGLNTQNIDGKLMVKSIILDSVGYKAGVNAGDEILAVNNIKVEPSFFKDILQYLDLKSTHTLQVFRGGELKNLSFNISNPVRNIKLIRHQEKTIW